MILLDSGVLLAFVHGKDIHHDDAVTILDKCRKGDYGVVFSTDYIVDETLTLAYARTKSCELSNLVEKMVFGIANHPKLISLLTISQEIFLKSRQLYTKYCSKGLSFTDVTNLAVIDTYGIQFLATFDTGFKGITNIINK